jgi:hypothetical protein
MRSPKGEDVGVVTVRLRQGCGVTAFARPSSLSQRSSYAGHASLMRLIGCAMRSPKGEAWWAHKGSNLGPLPCEGNALPLSYAPGNRGCQKAAIYEARGGGVKRRLRLIVVPAEAGTHKHRLEQAAKIVVQRAKPEGSRRMGPRVCGDDIGVGYIQAIAHHLTACRLSPLICPSR